MRRGLPQLLALLVALALPGCGLEPPEQEWVPAVGAAVAKPLLPREACADRDPLRRPLYGDLHVHTGFSMDAQAQGTTTTPDDAYRFAMGAPIEIYGGSEAAEPRSRRLERPLDFAAVTDHAEWMAEVSLCITPGSEAYDTRGCQIYRGERRSLISRVFGLSGFVGRMPGIVTIGGRPEAICGEEGTRCRERLRDIWKATQESAERFYDRSAACRFTTFHAWEHSYSPASSKVHRNVILRNEISPELPLSTIDTPDGVTLRRRLAELCNRTGTGCDAIAIPHNPNLSNGRTYRLWYTDLPPAEQVAEATLRAEIEPILEMMQIKGESECRNGMFEVRGGPDEFCSFEKMRDAGQPDLEDCDEGFGSGAQRGRGCTSRLDFARYALLEGVREEARIGVNPYKFGFIGSTDNHTATPGAVEELRAEKFGFTTERLLTAGELRRSPAFWSPGGLAAVWAEENSRDAIFDALERREAFATSGPRIAPRFFGGWELPPDLCSRDDLTRTGYERGVPMGADLPPRTNDAPPVFVVSAMRDPGTRALPGGLLQRIQLIKGWVDDEGLFHQRVFDVAGGANDADVDLDSCEPGGAGHESLCAVFEDPEFDADRDAVYYARVIENPSCRWTTRLCNTLPDAGRPDGCDHPSVPKTVQERAWTSPIWYDAGR